MKISERTIKRLADIITGDKPVSPYRSGPQLVSFFNEFGTNHTYGQGFPSRWMFAEQCIRQFNDTPTLKKIILSTLDPRDFMGVTVFNLKTLERKPANLQEALTYLNEFLAFDGYEIVPHGKTYDIADKTRGERSAERTSRRCTMPGPRCSLGARSAKSCRNFGINRSRKHASTFAGKISSI